MRMQRLLGGAALAVVAVVLSATPAFAHYCINESKQNPYAGAKFVVVITPTGEDEMTLGKSSDKAKGGFVVIDATAVGLGIYSVFLPGTGVLPAGALFSGPGGEFVVEGCDGKGVGDLTDCLPFLEEEMD